MLIESSLKSVQMEGKLASRNPDLRALGQYQSPQVPGVVLGEARAMTHRSPKWLKILKGTTAPLDPIHSIKLRVSPFQGFHQAANYRIRKKKWPGITEIPSDPNSC